MKHPLVSVIMGTFNPDIGQLHRAMESIILQTYPAWEMIIYDDGSCDDCSREIQRLAQKDRRIRYFRGKKNRGLAYGLNFAISRAEGEFLARMDDDDISHPRRLERQVRFLKNHKEFGWTGCQAELFDENGVWGRMECPGIPSKTDFLNYSPYIHPSVMFRREIFKSRTGYRVSKMTARCEDYELFMRLSSEGLQGYNLQEALLFYRKKEAYLSRKLCYSLGECVTRAKGFIKLNIRNPLQLLYILKPIAVYALSRCPHMAQLLPKRNQQKHTVSGDHILSACMNLYIVWLLRQALQDGVRVLYFLARDGYLMHQTALRMCRKYNINIECRYFYCSRYSLRLPMYSENISEALDYITRDGMDVSVNRILLRAGFDKKDIPEISDNLQLSCSADEVLSRYGLRKIRNQMLHNADFIERLCKISEVKWEAVKEYFFQEGLLRDGIGIVDSGWTGTIQKSIRDIRVRAGAAADIRGYYFGLYEIPRGCEANRYQSFYFSPHKGFLNKLFFSNCFFEAVFRAGHGTTVGYEKVQGQVVPVLLSSDVQEKTLRETAGACRKYTENFLDSHSREDFFRLNIEKEKKRLEGALQRLMKKPARHEAVRYGTLKFSDDLLEENPKELAPRMSMEELEENHFFVRILSAAGIRKKRITQSAWYEASVVRSTDRTIYHRISYAAYRSCILIKKGIEKNWK